MRNKKLILIIASALILLGSGSLIAYKNHAFSNTAEVSTSSPTKRNQVNYSPPTQEEKDAGNQQKQQIVQKKATEQPAQSANLTISNTSQSGNTIRVRAFVSNAVESDGTCTTTLTNGANTVTKETAAFADASTSQCGAIDFTRNQFTTTGIWQVKVNYQSSTLQGSTTGTINIQ